MLKILHINAEMELRGGELQTILLADKLERKGHSSLILCQPGSGTEKESEKRGVKFETLLMRSDMDFPAALKISKIAGSYRADIIHSHNPRALGISFLARIAGCRIKHVHTRRVDFPLKSRFFSRLKYSKCPEMIIAVSESVKKVLVDSGINGEKIRVIPGGIDKNRFQPGSSGISLRSEFGIPDSSFIIGSTSHFSAHKGHRFLIEAMPEVINAHPDTFLFLVGKGKLEDDLKRYASSLGIGSHVIFTGFRDDIEQFLPQIDLFVFPSFEGEGSPSALKEAILSGVPIIASDITPVREIISHNVNGILVEPKNSSAISFAIKKLMADENIRKKLVKNGLELSCGSFGEELMVSAVENLYFEIL